MTEDFNKWWDSNYIDKGNPYEEDTPIFWAWEGWVAGAEAERENFVVSAKQHSNNAADRLAAEILKKAEVVERFDNNTITVRLIEDWFTDFEVLVEMQDREREKRGE